MKYNLPERLSHEISGFARKAGISRIILFGSRARGDNTERSDVDIAVYGGDFNAFYWDVKERTHSLLMFDIIDGDHMASSDLRKEIERDGIVIYEKA